MNVTDFGAVPGMVEDCSAAFNSAMEAAAGGEVIIPAGSYPIAASTGIRVRRPGTTLRFDPQAILVLLPNAQESYRMLEINAPDVSVFGGIFVGDVDKHAGSAGEWGHLVVIEGGGHRALVSGITATRAWGDGCAIQGNPVGVTVTDSVFDSNRRQGMSIIAATNPRVERCQFLNTGRVRSTAPGAGIDVEPNPSSNQSVVNATITDCLSSNNVGPGFAAVSARGVSTTATLSDCTATSNQQAGYAISPTTGADPQGVRVQLRGCSAMANVGPGFAALTGQVLVTDCIATGNRAAGFLMAAGDAKLVNPVATSNAGRGIEYAGPSLGAPGASGAVLTGNGIAP